MRSPLALSTALAAILFPLSGQAQKGSPQIRPLGRIVTTSKPVLNSIASIRQLSDGRVVANDPLGHRVVLFDSSLSSFLTVADTTSGTQKAYGTSLGGIIPYLGDSTLFVDVASLSFLVISPEGKIAHVIAIPKTDDIISIALPTSGAAFDPQGRLIYRQSVSMGRGLGIAKMAGGAAGGGAGDGKGPQLPVAPSDSSPIVRVDLRTRKIDTIAQLHVPQNQFVTTTLPSGGTMMQSMKNPLPLVDDWALLRDGSVAVVRAQDYHVDWVASDGSKKSSGKIAHLWQRMSDSEKVALLDSVKTADSLASVKAAFQQAAAATSGGAQPSDGGVTSFSSGDGSGMSMKIAMSSAMDGSGGGGTRMIVSNGPGGALGAGLAGLNLSKPQYIPATDLPDYRPAFLSPGARADADGNLWIRVNPTKALDAGPVYEVVNGKGELIDRVQIPGGCSIVGFAPGSVYLTSRDGTGVHLAKARIH